MDTSIPGLDPTYLIPMDTIRGKPTSKKDKQEGYGQRKKRVSRSTTAKQPTVPVKAPIKKTIRKKPKKTTDKRAKAKKITVKKAISKTTKCVPCKKPKVVKKKAKKVTKKKNKDC